MTLLSGDGGRTSRLGKCLLWAGFSTKWYGELLRDTQLMGAVWMSLKIAVLSAFAAVVLGAIIWLAARVHPFAG